MQGALSIERIDTGDSEGYNKFVTRRNGTGGT
jgi:hypothetical protein